MRCCIVIFLFACLLGSRGETLVWEKSLDSNLLGYYVYYGAMGDETYSSVFVSTNAFDLSHLKTGKTYVFQITVYNFWESELSPVFIYKKLPRKEDVRLNIRKEQYIELNWQGIEGLNYTLEYTSDWRNWIPVYTNLCTTNGMISFTDSSLTNRYFRVKVE